MIPYVKMNYVNLQRIKISMNQNDVFFFLASIRTEVIMCFHRCFFFHCIYSILSNFIIIKI